MEQTHDDVKHALVQHFLRAGFVATCADDLAHQLCTRGRTFVSTTFITATVVQCIHGLPMRRTLTVRFVNGPNRDGVCDLHLQLD